MDYQNIIYPSTKGITQRHSRFLIHRFLSFLNLSHSPSEVSYHRIGLIPSSTRIGLPQYIIQGISIIRYHGIQAFRIFHGIIQFPMRRPQTSKASYGHYSQKSFAKASQENADPQVCGQCCKSKLSLNKSLSRYQVEEPNSSIPVESNLKGSLAESSRNVVRSGSARDLSRVMRNTNNLSHIETDQLKSIISSNMKYYGEKTKVCCSVKPPKHKLVLPSKTGASIYKADYNRKIPGSDLAFKPLDMYRSSLPFDPNTTYKQNYVPHANLAMASSRPKYTPLEDGPRFLNTQYRGEFLPWETKPMDKFLPTNNVVFEAGNFDPRTVYKGDFKGKPGELTPNPTNHKASSIFKGFDMPKTTNYQGQYYKKPLAKQNNYIPRYQAAPGLSLPEQYNTQYKSQFVPKEKDHCSYKKEYKNPEEMATMILNL